MTATITSPEEFYTDNLSIGDVLSDGCSDYILAQISTGRVCAVGLVDGNRYKDPVVVEDIKEINFAELQWILSIPNEEADWRLVRKGNKTYG